MTSDWPSDLTSTFDLVHSRFALPGTGIHSPRSVVSRLVALVKPGGYIQQSEMVFTPWPSNGPAMKEFQQACIDVFTMVIGGQELEYLYNIGKWYREMGLEDVQYEIYTIPIGVKAKSERIRDISIESFELTCQGLVDTTKVLPPISISPERLATLPQRLRKELTEIGEAWQPFAIWDRKGV
ncbi:hypothetical protein BPAE_0160g00090 [Botrytis paeoniae]|uniref:Methyltransferase type 11 domain-containing protein n=1 Tax=Botrytis paeoniae TaxID=278948 RepID=A0A4Z1FJ37_9HELO|nr:hypothetical protein BPAE_0160g00090 [Botrytis paeoniae]